MGSYQKNLNSLKADAIKDISNAYKCDFSSLGQDNFTFFMDKRQIKEEEETLSLALLIANTPESEGCLEGNVLNLNLQIAQNKKVKSLLLDIYMKQYSENVIFKQPVYFQTNTEKNAKIRVFIIEKGESITFTIVKPYRSQDIIFPTESISHLEKLGAHEFGHSMKFNFKKE